MKTLYKITFLILFAGVLHSCGGGKENTNSSGQNSQPQVSKNLADKSAPVNEGENDSVTKAGKSVFLTYCAVCHQKDGTGIEGMNPPLAGTDWVTGDKIRLINVVLKGMSEEIEVNGKLYNNVMAPHDFLTDKQISEVLTYIRSSFGNEASAVTEEEVKAVRGS